LITIFDFNMPGRTGIGHEMPPAGIAVACRNNYTGPNPSPVAQPAGPAHSNVVAAGPATALPSPPGMKPARRTAKRQMGDGDLVPGA
jgi:hypothetical protein